MLWESAWHSNLSVDYQVYLDAFPNGLFAPMAKNRIALLGSAPMTTRAPEAAEIGTYDTEKNLRFGVADHKEIQKRLKVLLYYNGAIDGSFDNVQTRQAIAEWQKKRQFVPTGLLGPVEVAALREESEEMYQGYLASLPEQQDAQPENPQAMPSVQTPATGYHQSYQYQPYHYQVHYPVYHYTRHSSRHYYRSYGGSYDGGGSIFNIFRSFF